VVQKEDLSHPQKGLEIAKTQDLKEKYC